MSGTNTDSTATPPSSVWTSALLISGTSLGAGLLALPIQTGLAGLIPALAGLLFIWGLMVLTGLILVDSFVAMKQPSAGLFSLYEQHLGKWSSWLVAPTFLLIFYGVMVAYLSGSGTVLADLLHLPKMEWGFLLLFFAVSSGVVLFGMQLINRANAGLMFLLIGSFIALLLLVGPNMDTTNFISLHWDFLPSALPIIVCAFTYQTIIPSICTNLHNDRRLIRKAVLYGTLLAFIINALWIIAVIGVLPVDSGSYSLFAAFTQNQPATIPLAGEIHSDALRLWGLIFSMAALFTSYVAVGEGLRSFLTDLLARTPIQTGSRTLIPAMTFLPPLAVALLYPQIFLEMLNLVGGLGVMILFGLLPGFIFLRRALGEKNRMKQWLGLLLCLICVVLIGLECAQEAGLLQINPQTEYWRGK